MNITATKQEIAAAAAYEQLHVPALFRQWALRMLDAADLQPGCRVLDVACGTGILAREARRRLGEGATVVGLDASPGMLTVAQQLDPTIQWQQGVAESLPHEDGSFDRVVSQFGLMFFVDRQQALREMLRVLTPEGVLAVAVWESLERSEAYPIVVTLLERLAGPEAADALRAPFVLGDRLQLAALFEEAGVSSITVTTHTGTARFPSIRTMVEADLRGWLPVMGVDLPEALIDEILREAEQSLAQYVRADGVVEFESPAHLVTGSKA